MLQIFKQMQPKKKLRICTILLVILAIWLLLMTIGSLSITASNLMITNQLSTQVELNNLKQNHSRYPCRQIVYLTSQRMIVAFDVLSLIMLPLLMFSVFKFYTKGNLIIIIINCVFQAMRWISALLFEVGQKSLRLNWFNLLKAAEYGNNPVCDIETCGQNILNYAMCGKLLLWHQALNFELGFIIIGIPLVGGVMVLAYQTNQLDMKLVEFSESTD